MVVWFTGLSGAGKTTICQYLFERLKPGVPELVLLDGDAMRATVSTDLGFTEADRMRQIARVQRLARLLSSQGLVVLVAVVYAHPDLLAWNRREIRDYVEVLVDAPMAVVQARDPKGLYARLLRGQTPHVVGVDVPWHRPLHPDLILDPSRHPTPAIAARAVAAAIPRLAGHWPLPSRGADL